MSIGASLFLIAIGAILRFAVNANIQGLNLQTIGVILMIVGIIGLIFSALWLTVLSDRRRDRAVAPDRDRDVYP